MRLKRTLNREVAGRKYYKWLLADLPPRILQKLGWKPSDALEAEARGDTLIIRRKTRTK